MKTRSSSPTAMHKMMALFFLALFCAFGFAQASEHGGKSEGGGAGPYAHLEAFTVNLAGSNQFVRVEIALKLSNEAINEKIKSHMPIVRHELIMLLTSKTAEQLSSMEGKKQLIQETMTTINRALELKKDAGVVDVLLESLIIQ